MAIRFECDNPSCGQTTNHRGNFFVYMDKEDIGDRVSDFDFEARVNALKDLVRSFGCPQCGGYVIVAES